MIWGKEGGKSRVVDVHVASLRKKLSSLAPPSARNTEKLIQTIRGEGYLIPAADNPIWPVDG